MGLHLGGNGKGEGGIPYNGGVHLETTEYIREVHCYMIADRPVCGGGQFIRGAGGDAMVGAGGDQSDRGKGSSGSGGGGGIGRCGGVT